MEIMNCLIFLTFLTLCRAQTKILEKRSYVCPPYFMRLSHRCYYFSKIKATWNDAYYNCKDLHGNLAIIKNKYQSKLITKTLNGSSEMLDRWLGAKYDWRQKTWIWAASGKSLAFENFYNSTIKVKEENLDWHCIFADPDYGYRWNYGNCLNKKYFICHTKIKLGSKRGIKKNRRQYNLNNFNHLNETPIALIFKENMTTKDNYVGYLKANFTLKPNPIKRNKHSKRRRPDSIEVIEKRFKNGTASISFKLPYYKENKRNRRKNKEEPHQNINSLDKHIKWNSYYKDSKNPLYPRPIIEEYAFFKE
ncbi:unnamed protein product [Brassicogethes aeneus]|uniref:C-type lectin domain-containing protein n=1 Tax=Brassicogethes aeneus TaxID=1431903 RepID=A0A9P0B8C0_BRAAE|nr:unnamed protein product [Brassicogethes aeneus]